MSKKKRIRRDIEKYERSGRYWDLLRLMESEDLVSTNAAGYKEAWNTVVRQALQQEGAFEQFFREVGTLRSVPRDPDCRLLMCVKEVINGEDKTEELMELKGLSPHAEKLRSKVIAFASAGSQGEKLYGLLEKFIRQPGKITGRCFEQVAGLVPVESLRASINQLGESINVVRRLNQKPAVARGWNAVKPPSLNQLDNRLERISRSMPQGLLDVLLYPYVHNLAVMCLRLAPDMSHDRASRLANSIPFLLPRLAGEEFGKVERKLLTGRNEPDDDDLDSLHQKVAGLSIEEKLTMLRDMRLRIGDSRAGGMRLDDLDFDADEDYDEDDDSGIDFPGEDEGRNSALARKLFLMYNAVLKDISSRTPGMPPREKKELVHVMEPIIFRDLDFMLDREDTPEVTVELLSAAMSAGCAGVRTGLLALLASTLLRRGDVRKQAEKHLDQLPVPAREDMEWLAGEWSEIYYPYVQSLRHILARYKDQRELIRAFPDKLCRLLEFEITKSAIFRDVPSFLKNVIGKDECSEPGIVRRELSVLTEYDVLNPVREFLRCYPNDKPTVEGNLCWLNALLARGPELVWQYISSQLQDYGKLESNKEEFFSGSIDRIVADKLEAVLLFMLEHPDQVSKLSIDRLGPILDELLARPQMMRNHVNFLIRLEKLFAERIAAGEGSLQPFMNRLRQTLLALAKPAKKPPKARRGKR